MKSIAQNIVIPGRAKREPGISRFRVWSFGPSRNDEKSRSASASLRSRILGAPLPLWERSDRIDRCDPGEGLRFIDRPEPLTPTLSRSKSDISDFDNLRCPTRVNPSWVG